MGWLNIKAGDILEIRAAVSKTHPMGITNRVYIGICHYTYKYFNPPYLCCMVVYANIPWYCVYARYP